MKTISQYKLIVVSALFLTMFYNFSFIKNIINTYSIENFNFIYIFSILLVLTSLNVFLFTLISSRYTTKPILIAVLIISSFTAYFMDTYHVVIDDSMIRNTFQTDIKESSDLFSLKLLIYLFFLGLLPSFLIYKLDIQYGSFKQELFSKLKILFVSIAIILIILFSFSKFYTSFFREHKPLRYHANPDYWIYSIVKYFAESADAGEVALKEIGKDIKIDENFSNPENKTELIIMVVGEAARADRFSINGYEKETNPLLKKEEIYSFSNFYSCGTSTAESVPCMFSILNKSEYSDKKAKSTENVIDILKHTEHVKVLWKDNNSDSKGVALRTEYENYKDPQNNPICDEVECRDEGMLIGLEKFIEKNKGEDILIVLHQMGNHGPAYYKRYPKEFEKFTPVCKTNQFEKCTSEEISNAYDNAILYTDYFLSKVINFLKPYSKTHETAMFYMSDHGESLGENGIYLHGLPYFMAPKEQKHIPALMWFGEGEIREDIDIEKIPSLLDKKFTHDNLFHTLLGIFEAQTKIYNPNMDILHDIRK
ncbi:phosphoethanolamine transferase [Campylobacter blaseri]|uniref:Phosphoethanolamine transferase n=1 Tax=Campylobacter blaseri TaxID=2042961 RepID=A0A2P8R0V3_9BACT|nr:phosphoethanolamine--lipid A transferase [Campylobacter blaseri]PSM52124.1 phosphoethanolamine transferase [Campylobacter blaseri]PSM53890.1 phosphoethanolamine transferase [Campylobacter blaseri]QKF85324.1 phosphoethanolamine transferase [Campylobacter blaseri]